MNRESSATILVAGAINTDLVAMVERAPRAGETVTGQGFGMHGGGKGANEAVAVARSSVSVALLSAVGEDAFGCERLAGLQADGISTAWIKTVPDRASGVALITVEAEGENRIAYIPGATLMVTAEDAIASLETVRPKILLAPNELPPETLLALVTRARVLGVRVILNAAPDPIDAIPLLPFVDILVVNWGEAEDMSGNPSEDHSVRQVAASLRRLGPSQLIITLGEEGAIGVDEGKVFTVRCPMVDAIDTTGAGDTFSGALAASLARDCPFRQAVEYAAAAAISVTRAGAQSSIPTRDEIDAFLRLRGQR